MDIRQIYNYCMAVKVDSDSKLINLYLELRNFINNNGSLCFINVCNNVACIMVMDSTKRKMDDLKYKCNGSRVTELQEFTLICSLSIVGLFDICIQHKRGIGEIYVLNGTNIKKI